ncbi:class I SAM-dependent methyltransferase [Mesobacillus maritimus]|uniref:class I SAM-dependent methyltransferase n=1 Tax=Mesobacillus maritimus TaxID=1643336 RepID=UPI0020412FC1|nr:class I SAM-dependent methyltransferase [Mesobacillus maritimus]MCM3670275.1 class I SAM-dependent methyltransferase [Mesobacillus maritimus]
MNNSWNKVIYKLWSPVYDRIFNSGTFLNARKKIFMNIEFKGSEKVLFVGVGTGADIELISHLDLDITAIDFSPDMLGKAKKKFKNSHTSFLEMDAQKMNFNDHSFDYVVGSLILSVVPDADQCFQEMSRVLKPGGIMIIFDKFVPKNKKLSLSKKLFRPIIKVLGTDIGLSFENLFNRNNKDLQIEEDADVLLNGMYRKIIISKIG